MARKQRWATGWLVAAVAIGSGCSAPEPDPVADLGVTVVAEDNALAPESGDGAIPVGEALRVTVPGETMDESSTVSSSSSTSSSTSSTTSTTPTTAPTISTVATTVSTTTMSTTSSTESSTSTSMAPSDSSTSSTTAGDTTTSTTATTTPQPAVNFPDISVTRHGSGQVASLVDQVAGSRPVLVWFWLPG